MNSDFWLRIGTGILLGHFIVRWWTVRKRLRETEDMLVCMLNAARGIGGSAALECAADKAWTLLYDRKVVL